MTTVEELEIKIKGIQVLLDGLGKVEAERFISLMMREPFDYTSWQRTLLEGKSVAEISSLAMQPRSDRGE